MSPTAARRRSTQHAGLQRDDVVERALEIVEEGGAAALSMRRLAADLGVTTTTIYWHVGSRDELVMAVLARQGERQAATGRVTGRAPRTRVASAARNIWRSARAHRNVTALANQVGATTLLELPLEVTLAVELEAAGLVGPAARDAMRAILACIAGFLVVAWRPTDGIPTEASPRTLWAGVQHPGLSEETRSAMAERADLDHLFETTLAGVVAAWVSGAVS